MQTYNVSRLPSMIKIGYDGENNWRPQAFDCTPLLQNHPNGTISLWLLPNGETQAFPVALTRDGNSVVWTPLSEEMTAAAGALQLVCTDGTDVGKSAVVLFRVDESILPGAEHPAAVPSWATQTIERSESAADRAEEAAESIDIAAIEAMIAQAVEDYLEEHPIEAPVQSVNGKTGAVVLGASDVHALPDSTVIPSAPLEIPVTQSGLTYTTTAKAEQIRAAKENSVFVVDGEARIKALLWLPLDEGVDLLIGMQTLNSTIMAVVATVTTNNVAITVEQTVIPTATSDLTNDSGFITENDVKAAPIDDTGGYFSNDTVEGALQEIGAELSGINTLIGSGVIS